MAENNRYADLVADNLETKERSAFYRVKYYDEVCEDDTELYKLLSDEDVAKINALLDDYIDRVYPEEVGGKEDHVWRRDIISEMIGEFSDMDCLETTDAMGRTMEVKNIDLYNPEKIENLRIC